MKHDSPIDAIIEALEFAKEGLGRIGIAQFGSGDATLGYAPVYFSMAKGILWEPSRLVDEHEGYTVLVDFAADTWARWIKEDPQAVTCRIYNGVRKALLYLRRPLPLSPAEEKKLLTCAKGHMTTVEFGDEVGGIWEENDPYRFHT